MVVTDDQLEAARREAKAQVMEDLAVALRFRVANPLQGALVESLSPTMARDIFQSVFGVMETEAEFGADPEQAKVIQLTHARADTGALQHLLDGEPAPVA